MVELLWRAAESMSVVPDHPCYEAKVKGGKYRVAPVVSSAGCVFVGYEAFFIPSDAESADDVHNIVGPFDNDPLNEDGKVIPNLTVEQAQEIVAQHHREKLSEELLRIVSKK